MDIFVGGKSGVFKGVKIGKKECQMKNIQNLVSLTENDEVTTISWGDDEEKEVLLACGSKQIRSVKVYDTECSTFTCSFFCNLGQGSINGISRYDGAILTAVNSGEVKLWKFKDEDEILINAGENLNRMRHSKINKNVIGTGGKENKLKLFNLERQEQIFIEKNLPDDFLQLRVPTWISDIDFLPGTEHIATCSRYGHVRLYDPKAQRRPVTNLTVKDEALTTLSVTPREKQIIVGSGKGRMNLIDLRKPGKILNTYKGFVGSVTGIACSMSEPYIVSVSLDRYLRVHHFDTKQLLKKIYLTSRLSCMVLRSEFSLLTEDETVEENMQNRRTNITEKGTIQENVDSDAEYDTLFDKMQVIGNKEDKVLINKIRKNQDLSLDNENESENSSLKRNRIAEKRTKKFKVDSTSL